MQEIDVRKHLEPNDFIGWSLFHLLNQNVIPDNGPIVKLECRMNGVEVDFTILAKKLELTYEENVNATAKSMISEMLNKL